MNRPEQDIQFAMVQLLMWAAVKDLVWFAIPNGGGRSKTEAAIFKGLGVKPGVADFGLVLPGGRAAFLELKSSKGRLSPDQKRFREDCLAAGAPRWPAAPMRRSLC